MIKITLTSHLKSKLFLACFSLLFMVSVSFGQSTSRLNGPISQLTINQNGDINCEMHSNDAIAMNHHQMGSAKTGLNHNGNQKSASSSKKGNGGSQIFVDYFNFDPTFPQEDFEIAATAFQSAVDAWASSISSEVPIFVAAVFQQLDSGVLGSAGPTFIFSNSPGMERDTWYGNALADKLSGEDLSPTSYDIVANFSTVFPNWYYGTDGNTPAGDFDFKTVVLHELGHGLGFFGSMFVDNSSGIGDYGFGIPDPIYPAIYDRLANSSDGKSILKENRYGNFTTALGDVLLEGPLTAKGPRIKKATNGKGAQLFTILDSAIFGEIPGLTDTWLPGSSYSHLDFVTYAGTENGLMVPFLSRGLAYASPDDIVLSIFDDMGWNGKVNREVMEDNSNSEDDDDDLLAGIENVLAVYPNPFVSFLNLTLAEGRSIKKASIADMSGSYYGIHKKAISGGSEATIDLSNFQGKSGLYFLQLTYDDNSSEVISIYKE